MRWRLAAVLLVTVLCLCWVLSYIDLEEAGHALAAVEWWTFLPMFAMYLLAHTLRSWRLGLLLGEKLPFRSLFSINAIGFLAINVVPLRLGEAVRPYLLQENHGIAYGHSVAAIVVERVIDLSMLLTMLLGLTWWVSLPAGGCVRSAPATCCARGRWPALTAMDRLAPAPIRWDQCMSDGVYTNYTKVSCKSKIGLRRSVVEWS